MSKIITVRLPEEISDKLDDLSLEIRRKKSFIIKSALEQYLDEYADYQIALDRLKNLLSGCIISDLEKKIAELKSRLPAHSLKPPMIQQLEALDEKLEKAKKTMQQP